MKLAAIDIGSNSIHLVIVRSARGQHLEIIDREKEMVRLGSGTLRKHMLSSETIDRAVTTLRRFKKMAEANGAELIIATATSAVRESHNASEFIERVRNEVGLEVKLLPGVEEARLIALAVSEVTDFNNRRALIFDIGGGSTEFIITSGGEPELLYSVKVGAVRLTEKYVSTDPISAEEHENLIANIRADLTRAVLEIKNVGFDFVIGTSGTCLNMVNAVVQAESVIGRNGSPDIEAFSETVTLEQLQRLNRRLVKMKVKQRSRVPGLEKGRADIIIAGGALLECILSEIGAEQVTSCDWSLREGVILDYLSQVEGERNKRKGTAGSNIRDGLLDESTADLVTEIRARSVLSLARRYDYDTAHSHRVARLATRIFDDTHDLHGLGEPERKLLQYAAILHDIGYHIAHNNHHRHGPYLIKNSEMPGFTGAEIGLMATAVRYHRGSLPKKSRNSRARREHEDYFALEGAQRATALKLAAILQIADGLDRSHRQAISDVKCAVSGVKVKFKVFGTDECDLEMWSAEKKSAMFAEIFGVVVSFKRVQAAAAASRRSVALGKN
ncbi:MAG TPA: Ppx/GppA phosphatase family protein [Blastocatellia bacterium]|jgi:exopolyphosphatase/guanosine-5'-triphosphate,3'-diphosphate pyrophosphatase